MVFLLTRVKWTADKDSKFCYLLKDYCIPQAKDNTFSFIPAVNQYDILFNCV